MCKRSRSTIERDHARAREHQAWEKIQDYSTVDWSSVNESLIEVYIHELESYLSEVENESLEEQLQELIDSIRSY